MSAIRRLRLRLERRRSCVPFATSCPLVASDGPDSSPSCHVQPRMQSAIAGLPSGLEGGLEGGLGALQVPRLADILW
ncbi:hypothetical protein ACFPRL_27320 [Pseudoclavibacter helvolus]